MSKYNGLTDLSDLLGKVQRIDGFVGWFGNENPNKYNGLTDLSDGLATKILTDNG